MSGNGPTPITCRWWENGCGVPTRRVMAVGENDQALEAQDAGYRQTIEAKSISQQDIEYQTG